MSSKKILTIIIICASIAFSAGIVSAESSPPTNFPVSLYGNVNIDGNPAPAGTTITAKAGPSPAGSTSVLTAGTYGVKEINSNLPVIASDGAQVDFYVNGIKATPSTTFTYNLSDGKAMKKFRVDLNAISGTSSGSSGTTGGSGSGGGGVSGAGGTPTVTAIQQPVGPKQPVSGTPATGTPVNTPGGAPPEFKFSTILGVFGILALGAIVIFALKKMGKI